MVLIGEGMNLKGRGRELRGFLVGLEKGLLGKLLNGMEKILELIRGDD
jgi:hypothetical protein